MNMFYERLRNGEFSIIAGPCVFESLDHASMIAQQLKTITSKWNINFCFKASYVKANRTSSKSFQGIGAIEALDGLNQIRQNLKIPVLTDIHTPIDISAPLWVDSFVDILQIPAFLCRQQELLQDAADTKKTINVKKGQWMSGLDAHNIVANLKDYGAKEIILTERGTMYGYNNLVVDVRNIVDMKKAGVPVFIDATHSCQRPGGDGNKSGGNREYALPIALAGIAAGADGVFMEVHNDPDNAPSDGPNMIKLEDVENFIHKCIMLFAASKVANENRGRT